MSKWKDILLITNKNTQKPFASMNLCLTELDDIVHDDLPEQVP
jgi:hypothetical protein